MSEVVEDRQGPDTPAARQRLWRPLAYLLNRTWINLAFFSVVLFQRFGMEDVAEVAGNVYRTSVFALAVALAACAVLHRQVIHLGQHRSFGLLGPVLAGAGVLVLAPCLAAGQVPNTPVLWGSAALTGTGSALVLLAVGRSFVGADVRDCIADVLWATVGCSLLTFAVGILPLGPAIAVEVALPFGVVAALRRVPYGSERARRGTLTFGERISARMLLKFAMCAGVLGIMAGVLRDLYTASSADAFSSTFQLLNAVVPLVVALVLIASMAPAHDASIEALYKPAAFVCIAGFAALPLFGADVTVPYVVVSAGYTLFEILVWVILAEVATRFQFTSVQVFGFGRALVLLVGVIAGAAVADTLIRLDTGEQLFAGVAAVAIISISFLRTYVLTSADLADFGRDLSGEVDATPCAAEGCAGCIRAAGRQAGRTGQSSGASPASTQPAATPRKVPFQRKCAIIGDYYGLTPRETDVFRLLAAGRNSTRIQEELAISAGTVNTHSYHVFQKLGVHSQQEVIDLFQHADLDVLQAQITARK